MTDFTEKKVQDRVQFFAVGDQVNECLGTVPERFAEAYRTMLRAEGVVPSASVASDPFRAALIAVLDTRTAEAKAELAMQNAAENYSDSSAETNAYAKAASAASEAEKAAHALLAAPQSAQMEVIASGNPLLYNVYGMFQQEDRGPEWQGDWRDVLAAIEQHLQRVNYPGNAPKRCAGSNRATPSTSQLPRQCAA